MILVAINYTKHIGSVLEDLNKEISKKRLFVYFNELRDEDPSNPLLIENVVYRQNPLGFLGDIVLIYGPEFEIRYAKFFDGDGCSEAVIEAYARDLKKELNNVRGQKEAWSSINKWDGF